MTYIYQNEEADRLSYRYGKNSGDFGLAHFSKSLKQSGMNDFYYLYRRNNGDDSAYRNTVLNKGLIAAEDRIIRLRKYYGKT